MSEELANKQSYKPTAIPKQALQLAQQPTKCQKAYSSVCIHTRHDLYSITHNVAHEDNPTPGPRAIGKFRNTERRITAGAHR